MTVDTHTKGKLNTLLVKSSGTIPVTTTAAGNDAIPSLQLPAAPPPQPRVRKPATTRWCWWDGVGWGFSGVDFLPLMSKRLDSDWVFSFSNLVHEKRIIKL